MRATRVNIQIEERINKGGRDFSSTCSARNFARTCAAGVQRNKFGEALCIDDRPSLYLRLSATNMR